MALASSLADLTTRVIGMTYKDTAIVLVGPRACGKSTLGRRLASLCSWPYVSFGGYVRRVASSRDEPTTRLEEIGSELIETRGYEGFLLDVLASSGEKTNNVVLDGVRHVDMLRAVRTIYRQEHSYYLDSSEYTRYKRWLAREEITDAPEHLRRFRSYANAPVERYVFSLREHATYVLDADRPLDLLVDEVMQNLR